MHIRDTHATGSVFTFAVSAMRDCRGGVAIPAAVVNTNGTFRDINDYTERPWHGRSVTVLPAVTIPLMRGMS